MAVQCPRCGGNAKYDPIETRNTVADLHSANRSGQLASQAFRGGHPAVGLAHIGYQVVKAGVKLGLKAYRDRHRYKCTKCFTRF